MALFIPELVAPGGSFEKLKLAILYGADAVYVAGENFGLRTAADNFSTAELIQAMEFVHSRGKKIYVVLNAFLHDKNFEGIDEFLELLNRHKVDAIVASDFGVITYIKKKYDLSIHLSTQNSCLNSYSALLCKELGIKRIVLGREVSIDEAQVIRQKSQLEMEIFIHGSMCMSYSGNCLISNYTFNRDANRGGCKHSCRFNYQIGSDQDYFYSSKDLCGFEHLDKISKARIDALKIEGRMKTPHYLATVVKAYREGLDQLKNQDNKNQPQLEELEKIKTRDYCFGNLIDKANEQSVFLKGKNEKTWDASGVVIDVIPGEFILLSVRCPFEVDDVLEFLPFIGNTLEMKIARMFDMEGDKVIAAKSGSIVKLPYLSNIAAGNVARVRRK